MYWIKNKIRNIKNFFLYGWRMREFRGWDWGYMLEGLAYMLKDMEEEHQREIDGEEICCFIGQEKVLREIKTARILCERLLEGDYWFGGIMGSRCDELSELDWDNDDDDNSIRPKYNLTESQKRMVAKSRKLAQAQHDAEVELFLKLFKKYRGWWS